MHRAIAALTALFVFLFPALAHAEGNTVHAPGIEPPVQVALEGLPETAQVRPVNELDGEPNHVQASLVLDRTQVAPGDTARIGVHLEHDPEWHTYWRSPGEVGQPTIIDWTLPEGWSAADHGWPVPDYFELAGIKSHGYDTEAFFFTELQVPADAQIGESVVVQADVGWLVCKTQCIPGATTLSLPIEVGTAGEPTAWAQLFDHWGARLPGKDIGLSEVGVEAVISQDKLRFDDEFSIAIVLTPTGEHKIELPKEGESTWPGFTPIYTDGAWMIMDGPTVETLPSGQVKIALTGFALESLDGALHPPSEWGGLVQYQVDGQWRRGEIVREIPWAEKESEILASTSPWITGEGLDVLADTTGSQTAGEATGAQSGGDQSFLAMLGLAFLGGIILNIMPCVLPVITLKLYGLVEQAGISNAERQKAGTFYTLGIVVSFLALGLAVILMRTVIGYDVGWGFQFQYPPYVIALGTIVFVFGLSLFGVFEVPGFGEQQMSDASNKEGAAGYFLSGAFATLLATPCSAPFLGTGMGFAFSLPSWGILLFFAVAGLGLAFPFAIVAFIPALYRFMPQPGAWMETAKQFLGFTLIGTTVWLVSVVGGQTGLDGAIGFVAFLTVVGVGAWIQGRFGGLSAPKKKQGMAFVGALVLSALGGWYFLKTEPVQAADCATEAAAFEELDFSEDIPWQPFSEPAVAELSGEHLVFVDFTADWCLTCKVNEKTVLNTEQVRGAMAERGVMPLKADWTNRDEVITKWLQRYGKAGVPFYLVIPADPSKEPIPLPEVITPESVISAFDQAG